MSKCCRSRGIHIAEFTFIKTYYWAACSKKNYRKLAMRWRSQPMVARHSAVWSIRSTPTTQCNTLRSFVRTKVTLQLRGRRRHWTRRLRFPVRGIFRRSEAICYVFGHFSVCMGRNSNRNSNISTSGPKFVVTIVLSDVDISQRNWNVGSCCSWGDVAVFTLLYARRRNESSIR